MHDPNGSTYLQAVIQQMAQTPHRIAFENSAGERLTYEELKGHSHALACWLTKTFLHETHIPVVLYGHKSPFMVVGMLACAMSGHPYVPVDTIYPPSRVRSIVEQLITQAGDAIVISTTCESLNVKTRTHSLNLDELRSICSEPTKEKDLHCLCPVHPEDTFYVLFTSGSTGAPKGVEMPTRYVDYFSRWLIDDYRSLATEEERSEGLVWFNRSPFSFDLSTDDLFCGLASGDTVFALEETAEASFSATFNALAKSNVTDWISTPSFVDACLADPSFSSELLPHLRRIMLAGETLKKDTVVRLRTRFPKAIVLNNYGPTETGTVSICTITDNMLSDERPLPIGYLGPEIEGHILDHDTLEPVGNEAPGELFIIGNVAKGYWGRPDLTERGFKSCPEGIAQGRSSYRTGDECILTEGGLLYYRGRFDTMVKLRGYRIEMGEIEAVLSSLEEVDLVCVLPLSRTDGTIYKLMAVIQPAATCSEHGRALTKHLKENVKDTLPSYMIPGTFRYVAAIPLNPNGKADRKALAQMMGV